MDASVKKLQEYMEKSNYTVAVTGAGISYMYGMRRFKQVAGEGTWMKKVTPKYIKAHPDEVYALFKDAFLDAIFKKGPGRVHKQLASLEKMGKLQGIVTQNLDYLHELAGSGNVVAFMGSFADNICLDCGAYYHDINIWNHGSMPVCPECGGYLVPMYFERFGHRFEAGESRPNEHMLKAQDMIAKAELLIIIATTGFHSDEYLSKLRPSTLIAQINPSSTIFDRMADVNIKMDAGDALEQILSKE